MFFWFAVIAGFMLLISDMDTGTIFLIAAGVVAAVRMTSYYNENLSQDLAKLIPLTLIVVFITDPASISWAEYMSTLEQIPGLAEILIYYILILSPLEFCMRIIYGIATHRT
jgi:membrane protein implicated in regulation of membrane protease activity